MLSDSESSDSDNGIRFKTASTRNKETFSSKSTVPNNGSSGSGSWRDRDNNRSDRSDRDRRNNRRSDNDRHRARSNSRERSNSERHPSRSNDRHRSPSKMVAREDRKIVEKPIKSVRESPENMEIAIEPITVEERSTDRHKAKKSKHKKHKRSKRDEKEHLKMIPSDAEPIATPSSIKTSREQSIDRHHHQRDDIDPNSICGPSLPPHLRNRLPDSPESAIRDRQHNNNETHLPTSSSSTSNNRRIAPVDGDGDEPPKSSGRIMGPAAPLPSQLIDQHDFVMSDISESEDDSLIGPIPIGTASMSDAHLELEKRAIELKLARYQELDQKNQPETKSREEWMLELPEVRSIADGGLSARQFRTKERPDMSDRSGWTETPRQKAAAGHNRKVPTAEEVKLQQQKEADKLYITRRDAEQEAAARRHKKKHKRDESLLDIHQKKMKRSKEKTESKSERRPFSRDTDLKVNRFDQAQKNAILKKAQLLDTRFGSGESKYL